MFKSLIGENIYSAIVKVMHPRLVGEIRLRVGRRIEVKSASTRKLSDYIVTSEDISSVVRKATKNSLYAYQDELRAGYLRYESGIRIGIGGEGVCDKGNILTFKNISSLNVRIPHEIIGAAEPLEKLLFPFADTLILSPPYCGKTTLIRDIARILSYERDILLLDERGELFCPTYTFGPYIDIISNTPKSLAIEGVIRAMSPEIIVMDELYPSIDGAVIEEIRRSGIKIVASAHAESHNEFFKYAPSLRDAFEYAVTLGNNPHAGSIKSIVRL